jgi:hypothetical protein
MVTSAAGLGDDVEITAVAYDPACDADGDTYRDCGNVAAQCCTSASRTCTGARSGTAATISHGDSSSPRHRTCKRRDAVLDLAVRPDGVARTTTLLCDNDARRRLCRR